MLDELRELWRYRELLISMVQREIRIRYKNSVLGFLWSFINPLITTLVFYVVFSLVLQNGVNNYSAYVLAAYLPFMFVQMATLDASQSILIQSQVIKKIYFPREILPIAAILANFIHLLLGVAVFFGFLLVVWILNPGVSPFQWASLGIPILLVGSLAISLGLGLLVAALNTFYEDVKYIVQVGMNLLFYLCPIVYLGDMVAYNPYNIKSNGWLWNIYHLNPLAVQSSAYREFLLAPQGVYINGVQKPVVGLRPFDYIYFFVSAFAILVFGYAVFNRMKWKFVERP